MVLKPKDENNRPKKNKKAIKEPIKRKKSKDFPSVTTVPSSIFQNRSYSVLETLAVYLKDEKGLRYAEIGRILARNERTLWTCYHRAKQKTWQKEEHHPESISIPLSIFRNRKVSFSESLIHYLRSQLGMRYHEIAVILNRDDRTIWTLSHRFEAKQEVHHE